MLDTQTMTYVHGELTGGIINGVEDLGTVFFVYMPRWSRVRDTETYKVEIKKIQQKRQRTVQHDDPLPRPVVEDIRFVYVVKEEQRRNVGIDATGCYKIGDLHMVKLHKICKILDSASNTAREKTDDLVTRLGEVANVVEDGNWRKFALFIVEDRGSDFTYYITVEERRLD